MGSRCWRELPTLADLLVRTAATADPAAGIVTPDGRTSWSAVLAGAERIAEQLLDLGVGPRSRVAVAADCSAEGVEILFACAALGAVAVPINTRFAVPEVRHVLADAGIEAVVVTGHPDSPADYPELIRAAAGLAGNPRALALDGLPSLRVAAAVGAVDGFVALDLAGPDPEATAARIGELRERVSLRQTALMVYTSGTTAHPSGCPLSHEAVVGVGVGVGRTRFRCTPADVLWDVLPLFHLSFLNPLLAILDAGGTFVTDRRFDPVRALAQIRDERVTVAFTCFPTIIEALVAQPDFAPVFAGVRLMLNVGPPETLRRLQALAPSTVQLTSYGSSEVGGIGATTSPDDPEDVRLGTNGRPLPGMEMAAMDPVDDELLPPGTQGEIVVRGPGLFDGYWNDPEKTARTAAAGGWFRSGDLGVVDADGRVSYRGRIKEMIKVGGENVAAMEVEVVLARHPDVAVVAVVGVPDPRLTEVPAAFVELRPGATASADDLLAHCRASLASFKVPRHLRFVDDWPMSATKIQKVALGRTLAAELGVG
ncbi:class I adenylate-forming enzyme family protein [Pseudonocardia sp. NPDC049154]|uniref:class I adenylate-forming enzyme family protein n=1 Tax=Pseudonocardia sp. NPDC049154 TaxID=3155501 RepID=UPI0033D41339